MATTVAPMPEGLGDVERPPVKQKRKYKVNSRLKMARTIKKAQKGTDLLLKKAPFSRVVREMVRANTYGRDALRVSPTALEALQAASEAYLVAVFQMTEASAERNARKTATETDFRAAVEVVGAP